MIVLGGATASGKSEIACELARRLNAEIISADSMSVYKHMDIGTAKPMECIGKVKHHLIDIVNPGEYFDAKIFESLALKAVQDIKGRGKLPIVCGGTYLYIQALLYGIEETPKPDWNLRKRLYTVIEKKGSEHLYSKLRLVDPQYARKIHPKDERRIVRALEVFIQSGRAFSSFHSWEKPRFDFRGFYIRWEWSSLSKRIEERVLHMFERGLVKEVENLLGFESFLTSSQAIGYKEVVPYLKGFITLEEAISSVMKNTKEYAKRQIRWFRRQGWTQVDAEKLGVEGSIEFILTSLTQPCI
ncbi:MAG: tRNA (adenosine(37)-N6)-dimethylallyltransferase MiaA [Aquificaceae bacterium]